MAGRRPGPVGLRPKTCLLRRLDREGRDVLDLTHGCMWKGAFATVPDPNVSRRGEMEHRVSRMPGMVVRAERRFIKEQLRRASSG